MSRNSKQPSLPPVYRKALHTWRPVILYFANQHCFACEIAGPIFRRVAEPYRHRASIYMLNTSECPRHPKVTGTPTMLFYKDGKLLKHLKGIRDEGTLVRVFAEHIGKVKPPAPRRKRLHDLAWLRRTLCTLRTIPDVRRRSFA
ncbi:thioredoxin family protein [Pseudomonas sp. B2M1-30]|uniref:thioredoxin family protein n=1 Tax=Pseudomonas TaxID=286 RepID=UPI0021C6B235|nr:MULTISPECIES: thioredoxin family protein [Pseudomonas]MCU0117524.1 thioredoxin family protein [Pseudomonas sp. B2M1-30]MCU7259060.1 thioredoxin family protein [Pseudomonas koreensis]